MKGRSIYGNQCNKFNKFCVVCGVLSVKYRLVGKVTKVIGTGSATFNSVVNLNSKKGTLSEKLTGKYSEGLEKYLLNLEKQYGTKYVFENVFKGDKSKYDPVKRAEEICGFQTSRISNGNMAEQFNRVLNGEISKSDTEFRFMPFSSNYQALNSIEHQMMLMSLGDCIPNDIKEYAKNQGISLDGYTLMGICIGESTGGNTTNYFGAVGILSDESKQFANNIAIDALIKSGIASNKADAEKMINSDDFYYQAGCVISYLNNTMNNNGSVRNCYECLTDTLISDINAWRNGERNGGNSSSGYDSRFTYRGEHSATKGVK